MIKIRTLAIALAAVAATAACTDAAAPPQERPSAAAEAPSAIASPAAPSAAAPSAAAPSAAVVGAKPRPVKAPAVVPGELVRTVETTDGDVPETRTTVHRQAEKNKVYAVETACSDQEPGHAVKYVVKVGAEERTVVKGDVDCDGEVLEVRISKLLRGRVLVDLEGEPVESAYAVIVPSE